VTPEEDALARTVSCLERLAVPYMLTGSIATSYYGRPRATHDADIVIDPTPADLELLLKELANAGFYLDINGARAALRMRRSFNVIEMNSACKIDLIIRKERPFSHEELGRRQRVDLNFGQGVAMVTPEDAILSKLEWARRSGDSERQLRDASGVVELNPSIDREYIATWASELGVSDLWSKIST
jgi:hypothetical protein